MSETKTSKRSSRTSGDDLTDTTAEAEDSFSEKMRRDHFPEVPGDNQQDMDDTGDYANPSGLSERDVKWPEVDSQEALDAKIDEAQTDKDQRIHDVARDADREANDR